MVLLFIVLEIPPPEIPDGSRIILDIAIELQY